MYGENPRGDVEMEKEPLSDHIISALQAEFKQEYEKDDNPINLVLAFQTAYQYDLPVPQWVLDHLYLIFKEYLESKGKAPLEKIFGFTRGKGQDRAFEVTALHKRDILLMKTIFELQKTFRMSVIDASEVATEFMHVMARGVAKDSSAWSIPASYVTAKKYNDNKWKKFFEGISFDPTKRPVFENMKNLFNDYSDERLKEKYRTKIEEAQRKVHSVSSYKDIGDLTPRNRSGR
jgi:hypothetical protein